VTRITGTLHEDNCTCMISVCILLRVTDTLDSSCREKYNNYFIFNNFFNRAFYETMWETHKIYCSVAIAAMVVRKRYNTDIF
jgi:hypothetical protein